LECIVVIIGVCLCLIELRYLSGRNGVRSTSYLYYPADEFGFDIAAQHKKHRHWLDRMKALPGWAHPYDLMPGHPLPQSDT
jgi:hypothetical protein